MTFPEQPSKPDFWKISQNITDFWKKEKIFEKSVDQRPADNPYRFYDGPPFVTGLPHYGSLLSSYCKDVIPRYQTMKGKKVERVRGWDCHGIPIEEKVQKKLNLANKNEIEANGIDAFIQGCYEYTRSNSAEWNRYVDAVGRWVDMDNAYKTMDNDYMESVWWVFKSIYEKKLMYEGKRVSMYSTKLSTPISNFEVAMDNTYGEVNDPAITVQFALMDEANTYILAWTTTPWTIPANMALGVHNDISYVKVAHEDNFYIVARARVEDIFKDKEYDIVDEFPGSRLVGKKYVPPFDYYYEKTGNVNDHQIVFAEFATDENGTGIVHQAPEFGEDDFNLGKKEGLTITEAMDDLGRYSEEISDLTGTFYRDANPIIMEKLASIGLLFHKASITHRVAFCPRTNIPLVYKAQDSWFVDIQSVKPKLLEKNEEINWFPAHFKHGRFAKSIEAAPDRCISRTRYWGTPMPVYRQKDAEGLFTKDETVVIGSRDELFSFNKDYKQLTKVIFVQHGHTDFSDEKKADDYSIDASQLSDTGKQQAQTIANRLATTHIDAIYSSPQQRCLQTLEPLLQNIGKEAIIDRRLREIDMPAYNGHSYSSASWVYIDEAVDEKDGESVPQCFERTMSFLEDIMQKHAGETIVICSHEEPLKLMEMFMEDCEYEEKKHHRIYSNHNHEAPLKIEYVFADTAKRLDLHRPYIDTIRITSPTTGKELFRIPEVLDCWFESGSMPYAQMHYPFENKEKMEASFPADYIVEYTGQIRAWFYIMHVLGVILFDKPAYKNVICTGVMQGNDGRKMSKSLGNFPDPKGSLKQYGGDAIRMHSLNSPVVYGGDLAVKEEAFLENVKKVILPLWNAFSFFTTYATIDGFSIEAADHTRDNILDQWIMGELHHLAHEVDTALSLYDIQGGATPLVKFLDNLTNWYIRRSRRRFWKSESDADKLQAYTTLYHVLTTFCQIAAPYMPFITEYIYKALTNEESVHLTYYPVSNKETINEDLSATMARVQEIIRIGLSWRARHNIRVRQPLPSLTIGVEVDEYFVSIISEELNVKQVLIDTSINEAVTKICKPNGRLIGPKFGKDVKTIISEAKSGNFQEHDDGSVSVAHFVLQPEEFEISYIKKDPDLDIEVENGIVVRIDGTITPALQREGYTRDLMRQIQDARKEAGYDIADRITLAIMPNNKNSGELTKKIIEEFGEFIMEETLSTLVDAIDNPDIKKEVALGEQSVFFALKK